MKSSLMTSSPQNAPETLAAGVQPLSGQQQKTDGGEQASKWAVLSLVAVGVFMATLDSSIVNISLPAIARAFGVPLSGAVEWVIIAYLVVVAAALLTTGRLADMIGRKPIWATGLALFTIGSALCGGASSLGLLIAARALQGFGGAFILAISPAMLTSAFAPHERGRALGLNAVVVALGVSAGPTQGGLITTSLSWRWIFFVNVPLGIISFIATLQALFQSPNNSALMEAAPKDQQGSASGFLATGRVVGQSVSVALAGALFTSLGGALAGSMLVAQPHVPVAQLSSLQQTFVSSFHATFLACAAIAALGIATSLVRGKERG